MRRTIIPFVIACVLGAGTQGMGSIITPFLDPLRWAPTLNNQEVIHLLQSGNIITSGNPTADPALYPFTQSVIDPDTSSGTVIVLRTPPKVAPTLTAVQLASRMSILYVTDPGARTVLAQSTGMRALPWLFRQEPSNSVGAAARGGAGAQRMTKVSGANLAKEARRVVGARAAFDFLKRAVDRTCTTPGGVNTCGAHLVGVDEIGAAFGAAPGDPRNMAAGNLLGAMRALKALSWPGGGSYASRIHFYVAPGVSTAISAGRGDSRTLGENGQAMFRDYSDVTAAMALAGGVWLEMYHYPTRGSARTPFTAAEWRDVPTRFATFLGEQTTGSPIRSPLDYLHFVMTETAGADLKSRIVCTRTPTGSSASHSNFVPGNITLDTLFQNTLDVLTPCMPTDTVCTSLAPTGAAAMEVAGRRRHQRPTSRELAMTNTLNITNITNIANETLIPLTITNPAEFAVNQPTKSGVMCQWQRAQTGTVNTRILANGPAAFKVTGTEADVFGQQFRQFFMVSEVMTGDGLAYLNSTPRTH